MSDPKAMGRVRGRDFRKLVDAGQYERSFVERTLEGHRSAAQDTDPNNRWSARYSEFFLKGFNE